MAQSKISTKWTVAVLLCLLSSVSLTIASNIPECSSTGIEITKGMQNMTSSGNLTSPNYPDWTPENSSCIWILTCPPGRLIKLYFDEVMFNNSSNNHSYLEIHDGVNAFSPLIINVTDGNEINNSMPYIYSSGQKMSLYLKKGLVEATGGMRFRISYSYVKPGNSCSVDNSDDENNNILLTPPFLLTAGADLPSKVDCTWKITPSIKGILMNITLNIKNNLFCRTGSLYIFDGPYGSASKMTHDLCQEQGGTSSFTSDVGLSFQLKSSSFSSSSLLQIQASEDDCIKIYGRYMTKNFNPQPLSRSQCQRKISSPSDGLLLFKIFFLNLPPGCENNTVQLFELDKHSNEATLRANFCGGPLVWPDIVIYSGQALVKVLINAEATQKPYGFATYFYPAGPPRDSHYCSLYNSPEQRANLRRSNRRGYIYISSPTIPSGNSFPYSPGMLCRWMIQPPNVTEKEQIKIRFVEFGFLKGYDKDCAQDHVQLDFGNGKVQRYCKATGDPSVVYSGDAKSVNITFVSTPLYTGNYGFTINYEVVPIVSSSSSQRLSWAVIGVLIGLVCLLEHPITM